MKISNIVLISQAAGSHFRGGTYQVKNSGSSIEVGFTHTWRKGRDGYGSSGCTQDDVINQVASSDVEFLNDYISSSQTGLSYQVTFVEDSLPNDYDHYCYGDGKHIYQYSQLPSTPAKYGWSSCCWVTLTGDDGQWHNGSGTMEQYMTVHDWSNNSPSFKLPPIWLIMSKCDGQYIDLAPTDQDGDRVKCRWATLDEAGGAYNDGVAWPSLSLDEDNCIVHYSGSIDSTQSGVKAIALMIEDFDSAGSIRSSIPIQFLAQVWTPDLNSRSNKIQYPDWFGQEEEHEDHITVSRGRRSVPSYCTAAPVFTQSTPTDGAELVSTTGQFNFSLGCTSQIGYIASFSYQESDFIYV